MDCFIAVICMSEFQFVIVSDFILYLYVREGYNAFNDFNFLKMEVTSYGR